MTLNVWDFGGQEIMRGTHRFFLTARSLYLLVLENRREDDRSVYDWLKTIRSRGGDSPVIVVINKCDGETANLRLDESGLRQEHPAIVGFVRTSCNPDEPLAASIARLRALIVGAARGQPAASSTCAIRSRSPGCGSRTRSPALARQERVLARPGFERLCESRG